MQHLLKFDLRFFFLPLIQCFRSRLPVELSCLISMLPSHSAIASARLQSLISIDSQSWGLVPQGLSLILDHISHAKIRMCICLICVGICSVTVLKFRV